MGAARAREDVDDARHAPHPSRGRALALDGGAPRGRGRGGRRRHGRDRRGAARSPADAARSSRTQSSSGSGPEPRERLASGWGWFLGDAAAAGLLCFGPPGGSEGDVRPPGRLARAAARVGARGGAAGGRCGATPTRTRRPVSASSASGSPRRWMSTCPRSRSSRRASSSVRLLPEYDPYVMGFREREHLVPPAVREQVKAHGKGRYEGPAGTPFLMIDGLAAGIWSRKKTAKRIERDGDAGAQARPRRTRRRRGRGGADRRLPRPRAEARRRLSYCGYGPAAVRSISSASTSRSTSSSFLIRTQLLPMSAFGSRSRKSSAT